MNTIDITPVIQAVISLACAIITVFLIPYIKSKYNAEQINKVIVVVDTVVKAAEKIGENLGLTGEQKKEYVVKRLEELGYTIDNTLNDYIEAAVLDLHDKLTK